MRSERPRWLTAWRVAALAGAGVLAGVAAFEHLAARMACVTVRPGGSPVEAFELVATPADVARLVTAPGCPHPFVEAQHAGLMLDSLWFIPAYFAFLSAAALATGSAWRRWLVAATLVAALCDEVENQLLLAILRGLPGSREQIDPLFWLVRVKFALLALTVAAIGMALAETRTRTALAAALPIAAGGLVSLSGLIALPNGRLIGGSTVAWLALLATAVVGSLFPRLLPAVSEHSHHGAKMMDLSE